MAYEYSTERAKVFTDSGQRMFLAIRDEANRLFSMAGAFRVQEVLIKAAGGDSWTMLACVDRLVELGEFRYVVTDCAGQYRILTK